MITLGIIGIVAALTIPSLTADIKRKEFESGFKKIYKDLTDVNENFKLDYGMNMCTYTFSYVFSEGNEYGIGDLPEQISKRLKIKYKNIDGIWNFKTISGGQANTDLLDDGGVNLDSIGRIWYFEYARPDTKCPIITVDLNGNKKPNTFGIDIFAFKAAKNGRIIPMGTQAYENDGTVGYGTIGDISDKNKYCSLTSSDGFNGLGCAYWAFLNEHPFEKGKDYWNDFLSGK